MSYESSKNWRHACTDAFNDFKSVVPNNIRVKSKLHCVQLVQAYIQYLESLCMVVDCSIGQNSLPQLKHDFFKAMESECLHKYKRKRKERELVINPSVVHAETISENCVHAAVPVDSHFAVTEEKISERNSIQGHEINLEDTKDNCISDLWKAAENRPTVDDLFWIELENCFSQ